MDDVLAQLGIRNGGDGAGRRARRETAPERAGDGPSSGAGAPRAGKAARKKGAPTGNRKRAAPGPRIRTPLGAVDVWLAGATLGLLTIGIVMVYSASIGPADARIGNPSFYLTRHVVNVAIGLLALVGGMLIPYGTWRRLSYPALLGSIALLVLLLFVGKTYGRSTRWLDVGFTNLQPSELAKFGFIVYLARSIADKTERMKRFSVGFLPHVIVLVVIMMLSLAQPDLGTCIILALLLVMMLFVAGTRMSFIMALAFLTAPVVARMIATSSARMDRILAFIDPWSYRFDEGFQTVNALTAFGSGGVTGAGLGAGPQSIGGFLPEAESDFILPIIGEELGFIGVTVVLALFVVLVVRGATIAWRVRDDFGRFLAFGLTMLIGVQASINAAVAVGLMPTKGLTLPFVSFGGSSLMVSLLTVGVLLNVSRAVSAPAPDSELALGVVSSGDGPPAVSPPEGDAGPLPVGLS
jgi:cell division protein FtsW